MSFYDEVFEEPVLLKEVVKEYQSGLGDRLRRCAASVASRPVVIFTGMGSSLYAAMTAKLILASKGRTAFVEEAGELLHYGSGMLSEDTALVAVSQSGESAETAAVLESFVAGADASAPRGERGVIVVTNDTESRMAKMTPHVLPLLAGVEGGTSSKTYISTVLVLTLLAAEIAGQELDAELFENCFDIMERNLTYWYNEAKRAVRFLSDRPTLSIVGRGFNLTTVFQTALILSEMARVQATPYPGGSFRHGPIELGGPEHAAVILAPSGATGSLMLKLGAELVSYGSKVWLLAEDGAVGEKGDGTDSGLLLTSMPSVPEMLSTLVYAMPMQLFAAEFAAQKGYVPGQLERCPKVTKVE